VVKVCFNRSNGCQPGDRTTLNVGELWALALVYILIRDHCFPISCANIGHEDDWLAGL